MRASAAAAQQQQQQQPAVPCQSMSEYLGDEPLGSRFSTAQMMADATTVRKRSATISPSTSPTDEPETFITDRKSDKSGSVSSCSSQETVLGAGDERSYRRDAHLPTGCDVINDVDASREDCEGVFYDEQPQMELMSPLVTRWRRAQSGVNAKIDYTSSANNKAISTDSSSPFPSSISTPNGSNHSRAFDGYTKLRDRKSSATGNGKTSPFSEFSSLQSSAGNLGNGGMLPFPTPCGEYRCTSVPTALSSASSTNPSANRKLLLDEVDIKSLQQLHQPWRRVNTYASDNEAGTPRKLGPTSVNKTIGTSGHPVGAANGGSSTKKNVMISRSSATPSPVEVDNRSKRKPVVGKLSLFDRLPAFMLQSHQAKQQQHQQAKSASKSSPSKGPATSHPASFQTTQHEHQQLRANQLITKGSGSTPFRQHTTAMGPSLSSAATPVHPSKFDDADEEALSPMATTASSSSPGSLVEPLRRAGCDEPLHRTNSTSSPSMESAVMLSASYSGRSVARSPSSLSDCSTFTATALNLTPPFPVASDPISTNVDHSSSSVCSTGSGVSPRSTISAYEITDEQNNAAEIRRLRQDLKWAREQVLLFTSRLSTNVSVIEAFDQSLCNMAHRLQRIANSNLLDTDELGELHATICSLRRQNWNQLPPDHGSIDMTATPALPPSHPHTPVMPALHQPPSQRNGVNGAAVTYGLMAPRTGARDILRRQTSSESVASGSSAVSAMSVQTTCGVEAADHQQKTVRSWLRSSFGKAFSRRKSPRDVSASRSSMTSSSTGVDPSSRSLRTSTECGPARMGSMPTITDQSALFGSVARRMSSNERHCGSTSAIGATQTSYEISSYLESTSRTPAHLAALDFVRGSETRSSKTSIASLPARSLSGSLATPKNISNVIGSDELLSNGRRATVSSHHKRSESVASPLRYTSTESMRSSNRDGSTLSDPQSSLGGHRLAVSVIVSSPGSADLARPTTGNTQSKELVIGTVMLNSSTTWSQLDCLVRRSFQDYLIRLDPATSIGLSGESVLSYRVGEIVRKKESDHPELLPIGYVVGKVSSIAITLKGSAENSVDKLAFELLVPKLILQRYVSLLVEHRRVILSGSTGTGKTFLAQRLAEFIVETCSGGGEGGVDAAADTIAVFQVDNQSSRELRHYLTNIAGLCTAAADSNSSNTAMWDDNVVDQHRKSPSMKTLPRVVILDNLHRASSLSDVFNGFFNVPYQCCPYVIGTMNQTTSCSAADLQMHHNFRWVLYANHIEPVRSFLGRYLRRQQLTTATAALLVAGGAQTRVAVTSGGLKDHLMSVTSSGNDVIGFDVIARVVDWLPKVWQRINQFLEAHTSCDITIGPRLFLSCPMDFDQAEVWFTDLWNYSIVPYLLEAVRDGIQGHGCRGQWQELADWVTETYPWKSTNPNYSDHHRQHLHTSLPPDSIHHPSQLRVPPSSSGSTSTCMPSTLSLPLLRLRLEDVGYSGSNGGGIITGGSQATKPRGPGVTRLQPPPEASEDFGTDDIEELDPLTDMLARLQEAALRYSDHDSDGNESVTS